MVRKGRYVYVCPACGGTSWTVGLGGTPGKFVETYSLVDGKAYPSCRQVELLCYWCKIERWGEEGSKCMAFPTVPVPANGSQSSMSSALDAGLLKGYPELWDFLTTSTLPDGTPRATGRLSVCFESGVLKLSLTDDHTRQYASLSGRRVDDLLTEIELRLGDGSLPWRPSSFQPKGKGRK